MDTTQPAITVYYLEMRDCDALKPKVAPAGFDVSIVDPPAPDLNRQFYESVGGAWDWTDRLAWSSDEWRAYADRPTLQTWIARMEDQEAGYFELELQEGGNVQLTYFGLLPAFIGRGLGGPLLTAAIQCAWAATNTQRVWLHTCTKDHQHALANYERRGFELYRMKTV